jgi:hypothetical protein
MASLGLEVERGFWRVAGHNLAIEYSMPVLERIRDAAIEGFNKLPHGGIEIGGVLFGARDGERVSVLDSQALACEYALGPSFSLSEKDQAELLHLLEQARRDPKLDGLIPVGWYHAHTRSEICLTDRDLSLHNRFFPEPWQIALVVRPANFAPTRAGFFFREANGRIRADQSYLEFTISPTETSRSASQPRAPVPPPHPLAASPPPQRPATARKPAHAWKRYAVAAMCGVLLAVGIAGAQLWLQQAPPATVTAVDTRQLRIRQLELEADLLRKKLAEQSEQTSRLEQAVSKLRDRDPVPLPDSRRIATPPEPKTTAVRLPPPVPQRAAPPARFQWSQPAPRPQAKHVEITPPPSIVGGISSAAAPRIAQLPAIPTPEKSAPPHAARSATPTAGRLIWTGRLQKNGTVIFDGKTVSSGVLNGELPGRPVHVNVYPADLSSDGLVLYSGDSKYVKGVAESPGPQNGWNRTLYSWDPHHAGGLIVAESPGPRNGWNRLVMRSKNAAISVIVVDWSAAP